MIRTTAHNPRGFTLVELMVVMTITTLVVGSATFILRNIAAAHRQATEKTEKHQNATAAIQAITTALHNAHRLGTVELTGTDDDSGEWPTDRLNLAVVGYRTIRHEQPESDVRTVEFALSAREGRPWLMRRADPTRFRAPNEGGVVEPVAANIVGLNFSFFNGMEWAPEWSGRNWPLLVRIEVARLTDAETGKVEWDRRLVNFPWVRDHQFTEGTDYR